MFSLLCSPYHRAHCESAVAHSCRTTGRWAVDAHPLFDHESPFTDASVV